ncbi:RidA family protein [Daejeonella lutea]|uniref:Enamine deaminase RidA, house cleaning of reactive enamine intermediates, YjgF/YER057c/UK114 family n=1 Tax=Daejeonella lutea TaxID=572036 RepID=A0A1T5ACR6_9SPHI|nr:RidA family protein [Daejeonella lutea]SKB32599.1 Enamine deaminase RidA, house cleaning of reactive enamine intermediates, YjgF/YER057c/UK114 family [Daejeonella lutea]
MKTERRSVLKKLFASAVGVTGLGAVANAKVLNSTPEKVAGNIVEYQGKKLFSNHVIHNGLVYIAGKGAHTDPFDIKSHTEIVLKELEKELIKAGSSMQKVLKVTVYLNDIADYKGMNEVYMGRFGDKPPVRSTIAVAKGGVPGDSLVEMDAIAYI